MPLPGRQRRVRAASAASGATAHVPGRSDVGSVRTVDRAIHRERDRIERVLDGLEQVRGIAGRRLEVADGLLAARRLAGARPSIEASEPRA